MDLLNNSRFRVIRELPPGRFSTSFLADDQLLGRRVLVRRLDRRAVPPHLQEQFYREARALASLRQASLPLVFDLLEDEAGLHLVMEPINGRPLDERMEQGAMIPEQALTVVRQVGEALAAAHRAGLIHRDLHPRNIYVAGRNRAKLTNFEIGRTPESPAATQVLSSIHVHEYLAPEQLFKGVADSRSDIYSLGMVLYRLLAGPAARVVIGGTRGRPIQLPAAPHWTPGLRRLLEPLLTQALAPEPERRFTSASAFVRALRACRSALPRSATPREEAVGANSLVQQQWGAL